MAIQPERPQTIGGVLDTAFQLYKASVLKVLPICAMLVLASSPPTIYMLAATDSNSTDPFAAMAVMMDPTYWLIYAVTMILTVWLVAALYIREYSIAVDQDTGSGAALRAAIARTLPLVLMWILFGLAFMVGSLLLIVPGLILMVSLMLGANLLLFENKGPVASLIGSHYLVWGNWWRTAAVLTVGFIILLVIYFAAAFVVGVMTPFLAESAGDAFLTGLIGGILLNVVINLLVTPFYVALLIAMYWDLKLRKEGGDLAARIGALNAA